MGLSQRVVTWYGATTDAFGIPDPFHSYLLVSRELDRGVWVATGTPLTESPHPAPVASAIGSREAMDELEQQLRDRFGHLKLRQVRGQNRRSHRALAPG